MVDVFISYPRAERDRVEPIKDKLEALDLDVFFDLDGIDGGANFPDVIDRALKASQAVLCCWSPLYFTRPWCLIECRYAVGEDLLTPVRLSEFDRKAPPADLMSINSYDLTDWRGEDAHEDWNRALKSLGKKVGRELAPELSTSWLGGLTAGPTPAPPAPAAAKADLLEDLRRTWSEFPARDDPAAVSRFLERVRAVAAGSGLEFEIEHHVDALTQREEVERTAVMARQREQQLIASPAGAVFRDTMRSGGEGPEMCVIPAGNFLMGSPEDELERRDSEGPQHRVTIARAFAMGRFAVTRAEFAQFIDASGRSMIGIYRWTGTKFEMDDDKDWRDPGFAQDDDHPVVGVSCEDAEAYCAWLTEETGADYRLPSEAEWEYACRAGTTWPFWWGASITPDQANYNGNHLYGGGGQKGVYREKTAPVDAFDPNPWGLFQVHGNTREWCADAWNESYQGAPTDGSVWTSGDASRAVLRGGSWFITPWFLRSAYRDWFHRSDRNVTFGFRLSRTLGAR